MRSAWDPCACGRRLAEAVGATEPHLDPLFEDGAQASSPSQSEEGLLALPLETALSTSSKASLRPQPHLEWAAAVRGQDAAGPRAPQAYWGMLNLLSNSRPQQVSIELLSARVSDAGSLIFWVELRFGPPPSAGETPAVDTRPRYRLQLEASRHIAERVGQQDPWEAART